MTTALTDATDAHTDPRLRSEAWRTAPHPRPRRWRLRALIGLDLVLAAWYFGWLLEPARIGNPVLYTLLAVVELFNLVQAAGFWWTVWHDRRRAPVVPLRYEVDVDVLIPVYGEPVHIVEPTVAAATRLRGVRAHVALLDDGNSPEMADLAARHGVRYLRRSVHTGAKAGNINAALKRTSSPYVVVVDSDHVLHPDFCVRTLGHFARHLVAFVQTPQHYANRVRGGVAAASWAQQALFFGTIARGKDAHGAMFCCGTNVAFRRSALEDVGGFPENSLTEDFAMSLAMHGRGWRSVYVDDVLALGLGPEDMASFVSQQLRWARGCLSAIPTVLRARLPWRRRAQYLLSAVYFLTGWTVLAYMTFPVVRILTGAQPLAQATADAFLLHFAPYFALSLTTVAVAGAGSYTFAGFALAAASWWVSVVSSVRAVLRRRGRFAVTPKEGAGSWQPQAVWPAMLAASTLTVSAVWGLLHSLSAAMVNNVAFALLHVGVLMAGMAPALEWRRGNADVAAAPGEADGGLEREVQAVG